MAKKQKSKSSRVYWRSGRAYGDFRDYADVGGRQDRLVAPGEKLATTDPDVASKLAAERVKHFEQRRRNKALLGIEEPAILASFAAHHLIDKKKAGKVTDQHLADLETRLRAAVEFFGADRDLSGISVKEVKAFARSLSVRPNGKGGTTSPGTVRHYLNALSGLYRKAQEEGAVTPGYNPVGSMLDKPTARREEAKWLEVHDAALLLEAARTYKPPVDQLATPFIFPIIATFLLTGGRRSEVLGLELNDVSFDRKKITFRPNHWRRLKTGTSARVVPMWPQLEEILREHVFGGSKAPGQLLFPSGRAESEQPVRELRKALDAVARRAGWNEGEIRTKMFRHTYCAARLQTLDNGQPVAKWTVANEMGHGGTRLVDRVYGHLGEVRHRSAVVEYRVEQHREKLNERLKRDSESGRTI